MLRERLEQAEEEWLETHPQEAQHASGDAEDESDAVRPEELANLHKEVNTAILFRCLNYLPTCHMLLIQAQAILSATQRTTHLGYICLAKLPVIERG